MVFRQWGQGPVTPAIAAGTDKRAPHHVQENAITSSAAEVIDWVGTHRTAAVRESASPVLRQKS